MRVSHDQRNEREIKKIKEELIRLLYVAMTRAKNHLFLLGNAQTNPFFHALTVQSLEHIHLENLGQTKKKKSDF